MIVCEVESNQILERLFYFLVMHMLGHILSLANGRLACREKGREQGRED